MLPYKLILPLTVIRVQFNKKVRTETFFEKGPVWRRSSLWMAVKSSLHLLCVVEKGEEKGEVIYKVSQHVLSFNLIRLWP